MGGFTSKKSVADAGFERLEGTKRRWDAKAHAWVEEPVNLTMLSEHFAKGAMRLVYRAWELKPGVKELSEENVLRDVVIKRIDPDTLTGHLDQTFQDRCNEEEAQTSSIADMYACAFNEACAAKGILAVPPGAPVDAAPEPVHVRYLPVYVVELKGIRETLGLEPYVRGEYVKHNNNAGYVSRRGHSTEVAQAFSYFSYVHSGKEQLVCDVQGVGSWWTDPQIHTMRGDELGMGNMGADGIADFLETHTNNHICEMLELPKSDFELARDAQREAETKEACENKKQEAGESKKQEALAPAEGAAEAERQLPASLNPATGVVRLRQLLDPPAPANVPS